MLAEWPERSDAAIAWVLAEWPERSDAAIAWVLAEWPERSDAAIAWVLAEWPERSDAAIAWVLAEWPERSDAAIAWVLAEWPERSDAAIAWVLAEWPERSDAAIAWVLAEWPERSDAAIAWVLAEWPERERCCDCEGVVCRDLYSTEIVRSPVTQPTANGGRAMRLVSAALGAVLTVALVASGCGDPQVPQAKSSGPDALVTATPTPAPATPTPTTTPLAAPTAEGGDLPEPTAVSIRQPGLTSDSIQIAVIADSETGGTADKLFRDAFSGTAAWAESVNSEGGLGDRVVKIVELDTALFNHRSVLDFACGGDFFAIVGGQSLGDYDGAELLGTEDCNIADFPGDVHGALRAESPNTFLANPIFNDVRQAGPARWLAEAFPETVDNVTVFSFDELQLRNETERLREMLVDVGLTINSIPTDLEEGPSERVLARYDEFATQAVVWNADPTRLIDLLQELESNEREPVWVLCELACYSQKFLDDGGSAAEGVYTWIPHSPFDSPTAATELINYRFWLGKTAPDTGWSMVGLQAWMAGRLFEHSFNRVLQVEPEAPLREQVITAARSIDDFTARGILPYTNPGGRVPTPCFALMVVQNGRWEQAHPQPPRDLDCSRSNMAPLIATRNLGLDTPVTASSTNSDQVEDDIVDPEDLENPEEIPE